MVATSGFSDLPSDIAGDIIRQGLAQIKPDNPRFIVFDSNYSQTVVEDEGETLHVAYPGLKTEVYAKLDDYGSKECLSENVGEPVDTQYLVTFLLAEEW